MLNKDFEVEEQEAREYAEELFEAIAIGNGDFTIDPNGEIQIDD